MSSYIEYKQRWLELDREFREADFWSDIAHKALMLRHELEVENPEHRARFEAERQALRAEVDQGEARSRNFMIVLTAMEEYDFAGHDRKYIESVVHRYCRHHKLSFDSQIEIERRILKRNGY